MALRRQSLGAGYAGIGPPRGAKPCGTREGRGRGGSLTAVTYIAVVSRWAEMVPRGMDPWGSFREAERFDPAMIPVTEGKKSPASANH